jgi:hypothetical protein
VNNTCNYQHCKALAAPRKPHADPHGYAIKLDSWVCGSNLRVTVTVTAATAMVATVNNYDQCEISLAAYRPARTEQSAMLTASGRHKGLYTATLTLDDAYMCSRGRAPIAKTTPLESCTRNHISAPRTAAALPSIGGQMHAPYMYHKKMCRYSQCSRVGVSNDNNVHLQSPLVDNLHPHGFGATDRHVSSPAKQCRRPASHPESRHLSPALRSLRARGRTLRDYHSAQHSRPSEPQVIVDNRHRCHKPAFQTMHTLPHPAPPHNLSVRGPLVSAAAPQTTHHLRFRRNHPCPLLQHPHSLGTDLFCWQHTKAYPLELDAMDRHIHGVQG